jgi:hypothetical protein
MTTYTATYTQDGTIYIDPDAAEIGTYDADGGTWEDEVRDILRQHGYEPVGDWRAVGDDSQITVQVAGTTIGDLAHAIAAEHGIDSFDAARDVVTVHVDQIADDPDLWNRDTETLTPAGVELVTGAVAESYRQGINSTTVDRLLDEIATAARDIAETEKRLAEQIADRDHLIRAALRTEARRCDIAAAAGVKEARLYQIRDGRR